MTTQSFDLEWEILPSFATISPSFQLVWAINAPGPEFDGISRSMNVTWGIWGTETISPVLTGAPTGLEGILTVSLMTELGGEVVAPTSSVIEEIPTGSGRYVATLPMVELGRYFVIWSDGVTTVNADLVVANARRFVRAPVVDGRVFNATEVVSTEFLRDEHGVVLAGVVQPDGTVELDEPTDLRVYFTGFVS